MPGASIAPAAAAASGPVIASIAWPLIAPERSRVARPSASMATMVDSTPTVDGRHRA
jgi:hypothetical protein